MYIYNYRCRYLYMYTSSSFSEISSQVHVPAVKDHLLYVTAFAWQQGRSHTAGTTVHGVGVFSRQTSTMVQHKYA